MSEALETVRVEDRTAWRRWLREHHAGSPGVWLLFYKAGSGHRRITYEEALEEALCIGWIDSIVRRLDDERYLQKFTPRRAGSDWSLSNRNRARRLQKAGRMMPEGLASAGPWIHQPEEAVPELPPIDIKVPDVFRDALRAVKGATQGYKALPPGERRLTIRWIMEAAREETRKRRAAEAARKLATGERIGLK